MDIGCLWVISGGHKISLKSRFYRNELGTGTVMEIIDAIEGPFRFAPCVDGLPVVDQGCPIECICPIREPIRRLHSSLRCFFEQLTLADLLAGKTQTMLNSLTIANT